MFPRRSYFLLASLNHLMNLFPRRSYFVLAPLNYLVNLFPRRSYFLLASLNYLMHVFPRRSYSLLASLNYLMNLFPTTTLIKKWWLPQICVLPLFLFRGRGTSSFTKYVHVFERDVLLGWGCWVHCAGRWGWARRGAAAQVQCEFRRVFRNAP